METKLLLPFLFILVACGGGAPPVAKSVSSDSPAPTQNVALPINQLVTATVYDAEGRASRCAAPNPDCHPEKRDFAFLDRCRLGGFQVRRCGCSDVCSGSVVSDSHYFDAKGVETNCLPESPECTPPETSARFQDDCEAIGHKLVLCGCQWLCNGVAVAPK